MENNETMDPISEQSYQLCRKYADEIDKAARLANTKGALEKYRPKIEKTPDLYEHVQMFREYLQTGDEAPGIEDILPEALLSQRIEAIMQARNLKAHFPAGYPVMLAVLPFSINGNQLKESEIKSGNYLRLLVLDQDPQNTKVQHGFSTFPSYINRLIPAEIQQSSAGFIIDGYENSDPANVTMNDRKKVAEKFARAFRQLKETLAKVMIPHSELN